MTSENLLSGLIGALIGGVVGALIVVRAEQWRWRSEPGVAIFRKCRDHQAACSQATATIVLI